MGHIVLIDGKSMVKRAVAQAPEEKSRSGIEIGGAKLFTYMIMKVIRKISEGRVPATHAAVIFDPPHEGTWRRAISPDYKALRPVDPEFDKQLEMSKEICQAMELAQATVATHEADDVIAAMTHDARAAGLRVSIISPDTDLMQLVGPGVMQLNPVSNVWYNSERVEEKVGVPPALVADFLALTGEAKDGIPGAAAIGAKTAATILQEMGSLEAALADPESVARPSARKSLVENVEDIRLSQALVRLDVEGCPRPLDLAACKVPDPAAASVTVTQIVEILEEDPGTDEPSEQDEGPGI